MQKHILIVEDNMTAMMVTKILMKNLGCDVDCACTGKEAVELFDKSHYDLVLMDLGLPDINGVEVSKTIREHEDDAHVAHTPIVAVTGNADPKQHKICLDVGMLDVVVKPMTTTIAASVLSNYT